MFKLEYKVGGRSVSKDAFIDNIGDAAVQLAASAIRERVSSVRCPVHGQSAGSVRVTRSGDKVSYEFTACCEQLKAAVAKAFE